MVGSSRKARKIYLQIVQNIQISGRLTKMTKVDNLTINFIEDDTQQLHNPYDDALVINLSIVDFNTQQELVDNRSSADILYYLAFQQMRIDKERLLPKDTPLVGFFGGTKVFPVGTITLLVTIGIYPQQLTKEISFLVVNCSFAYNTIIGTYA